MRGWPAWRTEVAAPLAAQKVVAKYRDAMRPAMVWTATHHFVVLAMHVAHQGDGEMQDEEQEAMVAACNRIGTEAHVPPASMVAMVDEACRAYEDARTAGVEQNLVADGIESLGAIFAAPVRVMLLRELREIAKAHGGVNEDEHEILVRMRQAWGITNLA